MSALVPVELWGSFCTCRFLFLLLWPGLRGFLRGCSMADFPGRHACRPVIALASSGSGRRRISTRAVPVSLDEGKTGRGWGRMRVTGWGRVSPEEPPHGRARPAALLGQECLRPAVSQSPLLASTRVLRLHPLPTWLLQRVCGLQSSLYEPGVVGGRAPMNPSQRPAL